MPRSRNLQHYPSKYGEYIEAAAVRNARIDITFETVLEARRIMGHYYAFLGVLRTEAKRIQAKDKAHHTSGDKDIIERAAQSFLCMIHLDKHADGTARLTWQNREHSWQSKALARATITEEPASPSGAGVPPKPAGPQAGVSLVEPPRAGPPPATLPSPIDSGADRLFKEFGIQGDDK